MKKFLMVLGFAASLGVAPAHAAGCLKGAAAGGVAGHFAGHHGLAGAAIGCGVGHHMAKKHAREDAARAHQERSRTATQTRHDDDKRHATHI